jgi:hypothetical protein
MRSIKMKAISLSLLCPLTLAIGAIPCPDSPDGQGLLAAMVGKWDIEVRYQWERKWITEQGIAVREWVLGGNYLSETIKAAEGEIESIRYFNWNAKQQTMTAVWLDAMSSAPSTFTGRMSSESELLLSGRERFPWSEEPMDVETSYRFEEDGAHKLVMSIVKDPNKPQLIFECSYRRSGG